MELRTDTAKFTNTVIARFRKCGDLIREDEVLVGDKDTVASGGDETVVYFSKLLFKSDKKKFII